MKNISYRYGVNLDWLDELAAAFNCEVENGHIYCSNDTITGTLYGLQINEELSVFIQDAVYHTDVFYKMSNNDDDFVGVYFNLSEGDTVQITDNMQKAVGRWAYNVAVIDSVLSADYLIGSGSNVFSISIFIKKTAFLRSISSIPNFQEIRDVIFDADRNTLVRFERASNQAWFLMSELRKVNFGSTLYDTYLVGTVYGLIADYLDQIIDHDIVLDRVYQEDIVSIVSSQSQLIEKLKQPFPSIKVLASSVNMSDSKYKNLFKKVTGTSAKAFFMANKLDAAKEMLDTGSYSIAEVAHHFSFYDPSHFIEQFKARYDVTPKEYVTLY